MVRRESGDAPRFRHRETVRRGIGRLGAPLCREMPLSEPAGLGRLVLATEVRASTALPTLAMTTSLDQDLRCDVCLSKQNQMTWLKAGVGQDNPHTALRLLGRRIRPTVSKGRAPRNRPLGLRDGFFYSSGQEGEKA